MTGRVLVDEQTALRELNITPRQLSQLVRDGEVVMLRIRKQRRYIFDAKRLTKEMEIDVGNRQKQEQEEV
ncbi:MAG: hypothetical protein KDD66_13685 [Bdellovibrionales bacterium]|nr:hypothetical protein [Planctomycetales bacterium]MCB0346164.1 hypothetical protein [Bdellovibrionales bacterium]